MLEVTASPLTQEQFKSKMRKIQAVLFDSALAVGLKVHDRLVGGHIHLDKKGHFGSNELLMRNFIVDLFNHSELFMGVLSLDYVNAPPVTTLGRNALEDLRQIITDYDKKTIGLETFLDLVNGRVYLQGESIQKDSKYQAVNLQNEETIEVRGFRPQKSAIHYYDMISLLEARIEYLKAIPGPIKFTGEDQSTQIKWAEVRGLHSYQTKYSPEMRAMRFYQYVTEAGLDWDSYKNYPVDKAVREESIKLKNPNSFVKEPSKKGAPRACKVIVGP